MTAVYRFRIDHEIIIKLKLHQLRFIGTLAASILASRASSIDLLP